MSRTYLLFLVGLACSAAMDGDSVADDILYEMNKLAPGLTKEYFELPGDTINFRNGAYWLVHEGTANSTGHWRRSGNTTLGRQGNGLYLTVPVNITNFMVNYPFDCHSNSGSGEYIMATKRTDEATLKFRLRKGAGVANCTGQVTSVRVEPPRNCDHPGTTNDFYIRPETMKSPSCVRGSFGSPSEYSTTFDQNICDAYPDVLRELVLQSARRAVKDFNFCA